MCEHTCLIFHSREKRGMKNSFLLSVISFNELTTFD